MDEYEKVIERNEELGKWFVKQYVRMRKTRNKKFWLLFGLRLREF
jgi:hypothetical protein